MRCLGHPVHSNALRKARLVCGQRQPARCSRARGAKKDVWLQTSDKATFLTALEAGLSTALFDDADQAAAWSGLASYTQLLVAPHHDDDAAKGGRCQAPPRPVTDAQTGAEVARLYPVHGPDDLQALEALITSSTTTTATLIMDATDWKIIPAENLVALAQASPGVTLMATAATCQEALTMLGALQVGTHGVVLRTDSAQEVRELLTALREAEGQRVQLQQATVTQVTPVGMGDRVCVDLTSMLRPGEGIMAGSFARGLFLVHSECADSAYIASRPFRVNAGAVHSYVLGPGGRTSYLSELRSASPVMVVGPGGETRGAYVGRCKLERRPMVLVEARTSDGALHSVILQNAETVKLVGWASSSAGPEAGASQHVSHSQGMLAGADKAGAAGGGEEGGGGAGVGGAWCALSVAGLQPGDVVLVHCPAGAARHTGLAVQEWVLEQ